MTRKPLKLGLGLALLFAGGLAALAAFEWRSYQTEVQERHSLLARVMADHAMRTLDGAAQASAQLAYDLEREASFGQNHLAQLMQQAMAYQPSLRGILLVGDDGVVIASTTPNEAGRTIPLGQLMENERKNHPWIGQPLPVRSVVDLSDSSRRAPRGVSVLPLMQRIGGDERGLLLVAQINPDSFSLFQSQMLEGGVAVSSLLTLQGSLVASPANHETKATKAYLLAPFRDFLPTREWGDWQGPGLFGDEQFASFRTAARWPVVAMVETSRRDALLGWWRDTRGELGLIAVAGLLILIATLATLRVQSARRHALAQRDAAQAAVTERDETLAVLIGSLQETVFRTDSEGHLVFVNDQIESLTGEPVPTLLGRPVWQLVSLPQRAGVRALFATRDLSTPQHIQVQLVERNGKPGAHVDLSLRALLRDGQLVGFAGSAFDASARVLAQRSLETQLNFLQQVLEMSPMPTSVFDLRRNYVFVNPAWERFMGRDRQDVIGTRVGKNMSEQQRALHESMDQELLANGRPLRYQAQARRADGALRDVIIFKLLLPGDPSTPTRILAKVLDVTELRDAERAMQEARDAAEETSRAKSEFVANISHELRTPLQAIIGFSEIGEMRSGEQPRLRGMFSDIQAAGQRMLALVNDLLDVAKLDSTVGGIHLERAELRQLVRGIAQELQPLLAPKQLELKLELPEQALPLHADPQRLQQVLRNLLANAIKFSPVQGRITVRAEGHAGSLAFSVSDEGPGVPDGELEAIFEAFTQSSRTKDGSGGTGLGLTISRKIAEAHGGRIWAENVAGSGARFHVELASRPANAPPTEPMAL